MNLGVELSGAPHPFYAITILTLDSSTHATIVYK